MIKTSETAHPSKLRICSTREGIPVPKMLKKYVLYKNYTAFADLSRNINVIFFRDQKFCLYDVFQDFTSLRNFLKAPRITKLSVSEVKKKLFQDFLTLHVRKYSIFPHYDY